jgi:hypothetical protein
MAMAGSGRLRAILYLGLPMLLAGFPGTAFSANPTFLKRQGRAIVDAQGKAVILRGVAFGNEVWSNVRIPGNHHGETDYARVAAMHMNADSGSIAVAAQSIP